jgi:putative nucleotidyltransferase with HDIG domain
VAVSVGAGLLVASLGMHEADEAVTAALLHDIGKIVLGSFVQKDMGAIDAVVAKGISFEVAEYIVLGINHAAIGARILQKWSLPDGLVNAVGRHHDPDSCSGSCRLSDVVHVANVVSRRAGFGKGREGQVPEPSTDVMGRLGIQSSHIDQLTAQTLQEVGRLTEIL